MWTQSGTFTSSVVSHSKPIYEQNHLVQFCVKRSIDNKKFPLCEVSFIWVTLISPIFVERFYLLRLAQVKHAMAKPKAFCPALGIPYCVKSLHKWSHFNVSVGHKGSNHRHYFTRWISVNQTLWHFRNLKYVGKETISGCIPQSVLIHNFYTVLLQALSLAPRHWCHWTIKLWAWSQIIIYLSILKAMLSG